MGRQGAPPHYLEKLIEEETRNLNAALELAAKREREGVPPESNAPFKLALIIEERIERHRREAAERFGIS